ncbi:MAG: TonB-dependent receptor [Pseudoflavonifractor sp.]|nr:TonB-dependent receptor [Pseudoflavonifractor sp.]
MAQNQIVKGVVLTEGDDEPLIGATVLPVGAGNGTSTDLSGRFTLNIPKSVKKIKVSYVGMETKTVDITNDDMIIWLKSTDNSLDEVMVVAYGTAKKSSFTGAATTVSGADIEKLSVSNVSKALAGGIPGVQTAIQSGQPGEAATIRIRGIGSINSSSNPLIVVDGMPYDGNLSSINPVDIESMTVLKDAASTALYGSRAANGVVVITTKKGNAQKTKVTLEARLGWNSRGISNYDIMTDPGEYMKTYWLVQRNQLGDGQAASDALFGKLGYNPFDCANNEIVNANGQLTSGRLLWTDNWTDEALTTGLRQEYNLTVSGGSEKSTHFLSVGYLDDEGIVANSDFSRFSARASGDYNVNKYIKINGMLAYSRGEQNAMNISLLSNLSNTFAFIQNIAPIYPVYGYKDGKPVYNEDGTRAYDFGDGTYGARAYGGNQNVVATDEVNMNRRVRDNFDSRFGASVSFLNDFKVEVNAGYEVTNLSRDQFMTPDFGDAQSVRGRGYKTRQRYQTLTVNELLTYNRTFAEKHSVDVLVGHENYKYTNNYLYNAKSHFFDPTVPEFDNAISMDRMDSFTEKYAIESVFGRLNYGFDDRYYLSASVRGDGSSRFAPGHRWGAFWSVGASWRLSKELFMQDVTWIDNLSLRASYGSVGNDDIYYPGNVNSVGYSNYYPYKSQYSVTPSDGEFAVTKVYQGNEDLTWETSYNANVGVSALLLDNLLNIDFEYFHKRTKNMLYNVPQAMSSGVSYISENALTMVNQGVEFTLGVNIPLPKDFIWNITLTGTHYKNEVTDIPEEKRVSGITHDSYYNFREGNSVWDFYTKSFAGLDENGKSLWYVDVLDEKGNVVGRETTGNYTNATDYYVGTALPDFQGGINTTFSWKGIDLSIAMNYSLGGKILDRMYMGLMHAGSNEGNNWHRDILGAWTEQNKGSMIPVLDGDQNGNAVSDRFLIGADYFNLHNITVGYTFPAKWTRKAFIEKARLYFTADNVALASKRKGLDPRQYIYGQSQANYSTIRTMSFGLSLTF